MRTTPGTRLWLRAWIAGLIAALAVAAVDLTGLVGVIAAPEQLAPIAWRLGLLAVVFAGFASIPLALATHASLRLVRRARRPRLFTLPWVVLAAPWAIALALSLFSGGMMRRLPGRSAGVVIVALLLLVLSDLSCRLLRRVRRRLTTRVRLALALGAAFAVILALGAVNRGVLPGLYDDLHATLALGSFLLVYVVASARPAPRPRRWALAGAAAVTGLAALLAVHSLGQGHALRASMHRPQAPGSRALLAWGGRFIPIPPAPATLAPRRERVRSADPGLPRWPRAHVLLVTIDALRPDRLGAYGNRRGLTPALDALAADGVVFEHALTQAPHSSYGLSSLMASEYLHETVQLGQPPPEATLPRVLRAAGYRTAGIYGEGIFHTHGEHLERYRASRFGLDDADHRWLDAEARTDAALAWVDATVAAGEPPSFLWVHYFDTHEPYRETSLGTSLTDRYDGEVRNVDRAVDRLVRETRRRLGKDVVLVVTADHGEELRDHGGLYHGSTLYEEQIRVPLIVHAPGLAPRRVREAVELVDLAPTLIAGLGLSVPRSMRGDDLRASLVGRPLALAPAMSAVNDRVAASDGRWKLIADLGSGVFELYDLARDPGERRNVVDAHPDVLARLHGELRAWLDALSEEDGTAAERALEMARLGDVRAAPLLGSMLTTRAGTEADRAEAARALGELPAADTTRALRIALRDPAPAVAAEAAIALGRRGDPRARRPLRALLEVEAHRERAAMALAPLGDPLAVPALVDVLAGSDDRAGREDAARWLGRLRDPRAFDPLVAALEQPRVRRHAAEALGRLGDPRALGHLLPLLDPELHFSVRIGAMLGLGRLDAAEATAPLVRLAVDSPEVLGTTEALVRLGALRRRAIGGVDFAPGMRALRCQRRRTAFDEPFTGRTTCRVTRSIRIAVRPPPPSASGYVVFLRGRSLERAVTIGLRLGDGRRREVELAMRWAETRIEVPEEEGNVTRVALDLPPDRPIELDHLLVVPRLPSGALTAQALSRGAAGIGELRGRPTEGR